ncbi:transcription factor HIVEP2a [Thalassophryne amazonica]|uniref:transcription factor HIVEP2a n=1 Tax=Thalassophryne amazonica TaxID=390379 RepID=UPI001470C021|nr:transcription factor HIVEP2a [Thalassophryne amazonica]
MEVRESTDTGQKYPNKEHMKEKGPLQRKWASEPSATTKRSTFADPGAKHRESFPCGGSAPQQKYTLTVNSGKLPSGPSAVGAIGGPSSQDPQGPFAQVFQRGYPYQLGLPYPQHPQTERLLSGAKPQPGLDPHAWPFAGQLPSEDLYPVVHPCHTHPHGTAAVRFPRQKSPSLPSSFGNYSQSGPEPGEEGYGKKDQKPKKPGKYICDFCGRACAKPSVLKKHIRSHTGERPYPCIPCGFSFKTKSNLYKHRKSHAHAIKAGLVPFSELAVMRSEEMDQASPVGEAEVHSDGEQSTDTDEEGMEGSTMLTDKESAVAQISFEADKNTGGVEPAYADSAEELSMVSVKVPILIVPKRGGVPSTGAEYPHFPDIKGSRHMLATHAGGIGHSMDDSPTIKQRLALRLTEKKVQDPDSATTQSLNLLSPHSKGSTDSGYFSRSESAEQQISPPNSNVKSYEEIMFGRTWYYRPNSRSRHSIPVGMAGADPTNLANLKQSGTILDMGKIAEDPVCFRGNVGISGNPKQYPTGPCQSNTGLLEPPSDSGHLFRSNSMPTSSPPNLSVPPGIRGSHSFDEMMTPDDVFYPAGLRRLRRQAAFEHSANEAQVGEAEGYVHMPKNLAQPSGIKIGEHSQGVPEHISYSSYGTKVSMPEIAPRKRRKEKSEGDEEDSPGHCDSSCSGSVEMSGDYEFKQGHVDGSRATPTGKGSLHSAHSQSDSFDTCASMCSEDIALFPDADSRKAAGNVISVIQHTNSLSRPNSFEKSESFEQLGHQPTERALLSQQSEHSDTEIFEDALSPESALLRTESMEQQPQSDSDLASISSSSTAPSPGQPYHIPHKLVRQPNIQVPEIRVTEEPDKPDKDTEPRMTKEAEKQQQQQHGVEEFQLPQRSDTLSQMPSEKLPPKKKRLRLADMEHSSGESSFESTCTSLSRSPSQESNLSHSSSFSMSFDRDEGLKPVSPTKQDELTAGGGVKQSEFLTVPGSGHSSHYQQREMRRSSSEQAPCKVPTELPEMRSKSFDFGSLSSSRQGELYSSASAMKERRRGYLVRQASLSVYPEAVAQEPPGAEMSVKQESLEQGVWPGTTGPAHGTSDVTSKAKRVSSNSVGQNQQLLQHVLQQSISEDSLQDEPVCSSRSQQHRLQAQGSSSEGEYLVQEVMNKEVFRQYQSSPPFLSFQQPGLFWSHEAPRQQLTLQTQQQLQKLHIRSPSNLPAQSHQQQQLHDQQPHDQKSESLPSFSSRDSPGCPQQRGHFSSSTSSMLLQQVQPVFATQNLNSHASVPGMLVPVRIQTHVPSFGSVMYTSVSQLIASHGSSLHGSSVPRGRASSSSTPHSVVIGGSTSSFNLSHFLGQTDETMLQYPLWKGPDSLPEQRLNTGIPLSITSGTVSTADASGSGAGSSKRMLSPASSLELFIETKQQKRVKEEKMYGQIVKEMSAVELGGTESSNNLKEEQRSPRVPLKSEDSVDDSERMNSSPPLNDFPIAIKIAVPVRSSAPHPPDVAQAESFTPPLQILTDRSPVSSGRDSPEELDVDDSTPEPNSSSQSRASSKELEEADSMRQSTSSKTTDSRRLQQAANKSAVLSRAVDQTLLLTEVADGQQVFQFPSLRTTSRVNWCFLNYTKPNSTQATPRNSVYSSWCVSSYNPNPLNLSTKAALALLRSKQRTNSNLIYMMAAMSPPSSGKLVSSVAWKLSFDQLKPELMPVEPSKLGRKMKGVASWEHSNEEQTEKEASVKQPPTEPTRIKIFEGGYKSNEDYIYVRGRGRGKYICEECGIRCKKPSMLKKHIRTHTDLRPYVCKFCNFAFKTKGNLTKHMKSKAHMKKCLELGVSMSSIEDADADDTDVGERACEKLQRCAMAEHQFSDADDSDGGEEDADDVDDEDDEEDDYDGDSTPKTRSRSTSPQPYSRPSLSITAVADSQTPPSSHEPSQQLTSDILGHAHKPPLFGYFTTVPSIQITPLAPPSDQTQAQYQHSLQGALGNRLLVPPSSIMDEDLSVPLLDQSSPSSRLSSPGLDHSSCPSPISPASSPSSRRYLSPRRDLSPRPGHISPRREISPLRHISPKRELVGCRRDLSPRRELSSRGHLSLLSPLSRATSPGGRDYKRDLSPRGRHKGVIRPVSPRRGFHQHLRHLSPQSGARGLRLGPQTGLLPGQKEPGPAGRHRTSTETEMERHLGLHLKGERKEGSHHGNQSSPPPPVLFSHLPLHSQLQVRSPFPMIPIGGIQMVHSIPVSFTSPLSQEGALQKSTSEESTNSDVTSSHFTSFAKAGGQGSPGRVETIRKELFPHISPRQETMSSNEGGGARQEQEDGIRTCTKAIASLCIDTGELIEGDGGASSSSASAPESQQQRHPPSVPTSPQSPQHSPSPPEGPSIQHFTLRSSSSAPPSPHPSTPGSQGLQLTAVSKLGSAPYVSVPEEREKEAESTQRGKDDS